MSSAPRLRGEGLQRTAEHLTDRDWSILRDVARFRLLTGRQLQLLHIGPGESAARTTRRVLARLTRDRLLVRLPRQVGGVRAGSSGQVVAIGPVGNRFIEDGQPRRRARDVSDGFLTHTLAIADIYLQLKLAEARGDLRVATVQTEPQCWRSLDRLGSGEWLKPDLYAVIACDDDAVHSYVEVDQGTEHRPALLRKMRTYEAAYRSGAGEGDDVFPRVVWLVPNDNRAALIRQLVAATPGLTSELHAVGLQTQAVSLLIGEVSP